SPHRRLYQGPPAHGRGEGRGRRDVAVALGQVAGEGGPTRRVLQATGPAGVDEQGRLRRAARLRPRARTPADGAPPRAGRRNADDGHDPDRPAGLPGRRVAGAAPAPLGRGDEPAAPEDHDEHGRAAETGKPGENRLTTWHYLGTPFLPHRLTGADAGQGNHDGGESDEAPPSFTAPWAGRPRRRRKAMFSANVVSTTTATSRCAILG